MNHAWIEKYFNCIFSTTNRRWFQKPMYGMHIRMPYTVRTIRKNHSDLDSISTHLPKFSDDRSICEISMLHNDRCCCLSEFSNDFSSHSQSILDRHEYLDSLLYLTHYPFPIFPSISHCNRVSKLPRQSYHIVMPSSWI